MTPPINIDGSTVDAITIDGTEVTEVTADGEVVFGSAIPDSVVSRPGDNRSSSDSQLLGMQLETDVEWSEIGARISANNSGLTRAYIYRVSDGQLMGETDISNVSAGQTFTMALDSPLVDGETYNFVADAEGASYTTGFNNNLSSYPYESSDGNLRFPNGALGTTSAAPNAFFIDEAGNVGFS